MRSTSHFPFQRLTFLLPKINDLQIDVMAITEAWLDYKINDDLVSLPDYSIVRNYREEGKCGGDVCAFIRSKTRFPTLRNLYIPDVENLLLRWLPTV